MNQYVVKLTNGEDIVCEVNEDTGSQLKISSPLKMDTIVRTTTKGVVESLSLARWVQPYSDEKYFNIEKISIVVMTPASVGLSRYYEYVLQNINEVVQRNRPTVKQLKKIEEEEEQMDLEEDLVSSEDLEAILDNFNTKKTYH
mgnify:CR=1 FL=1|jgi:hypothetical protein|tara:strand:+ start:249 stop:677 length:429 start_codon:yes stop_codon:yes gene_type:complete